MDYTRELQFTQRLLSNFRLKMRFLDSGSPDLSTPGVGLQEVLNFHVTDADMLPYLNEYCKDNTIYRIENPLFCRYLLFRLPDRKPSMYAYIGPYVQEPVSQENILRLAEKFQVAPGNLRQLEQFYLDLPLIPSENTLFTILYTLGEHMWGSIDHFTIQTTTDFYVADTDAIVPAPDASTPEEALLSMQILEARYETEQALTQAIAGGQLHKAELYFEKLSNRQYEERANTHLRTMKNYGLALNTLSRKAAEAGAVHPLHIDSISTKYARQIEAAASEAELHSLMREMIRKYCLLVQNHSLKGYSLLIRKVITRIDFDLTADLSLKTQAQLLSVNPSYLSTLFKKETGVTLTEYVNRKRIEHALLLLNSTNMQIQLVALHCGIPDVNYFTKTFKKLVGRTPKDYREMISNPL